VKRREFITLLGGSAAAWPLAARAQQLRRRARLGVFGSSLNNPIYALPYAGFLDELQKAGFRDQHNLQVEFRPIDQPGSDLRALALEIIRSRVDATLVAGPLAALQAMMAAGPDIPIVILAINYDPIEHGYVKSLSRPGGIVTGLFMRQTELAEKQVELLTQALPGKTRLAILWDAFSADQFETGRRRAQAFGLQTQSFKLENPPYDFEATFRAIAAAQQDMLLVLSSQHFGPHAQRIGALTLQFRLPAMFIFRGYADAGGLISYGADFKAMFRQCAAYVAKILQGAKPGDLPVEQPNKFEMVLNLKSARQIGVEIPSSIQLRADEVIE
jgi:putative ABC transport system substrate-binding protein